MCVLAALQTPACTLKATHNYEADSESYAYVGEAIPAIFGSWDSEALLKRVSPEYLKSTNSEQTKRFFADASAIFGPMKAYHDLKGSATDIYDSTGNPKQITLFTANLDFLKRPATLRLQLSKADDNWQIDGWHVDVRADNS